MVFNQRFTPDEAEREAIANLKAAISHFEVPKLPHDPQHDDEITLLRFVRGYHGKVKDAAKAFEEMLEYRKANSVDAMRAALVDGEALCWPQELAKFAPLVACTGGGLMRHLGLSLSGMPATVCLIHLYDVKKVIKEGLVPLLLELQQHQDEYWHVRLHRSSLAARAVHARVDVIGAHELGMFHFGVSEARVLMRVLEGAKHYPESCAHIVSVGNGKALVAMYNAVIRPFMPRHTKEKIVVMGRDIENTKCQEQIGVDDAAYASLLELTGRVQSARAEPEPVAEIS